MRIAIPASQSRHSSCSIRPTDIPPPALGGNGMRFRPVLSPLPAVYVTSLSPTIAQRINAMQLRRSAVAGSSNR